MPFLWLVISLLLPARAENQCTGAAPISSVADLGQLLQSGGSSVAPPAPASNPYALPVPAGTRITSDYGYRIHPIKKTRKLHKGIDFGMSRGSNVFSPGSGKVISASWVSGYGRYLIVQLDDGSKIAYAHLKDFNNLKVGAEVKAGDVVGHVNNSGSSTGDHLHLETWNTEGALVNPRDFFGLSSGSTVAR